MYIIHLWAMCIHFFFRLLQIYARRISKARRECCLLLRKMYDECLFLLDSTNDECLFLLDIQTVPNSRFKIYGLRRAK